MAVQPVFPELTRIVSPRRLQPTLAEGFSRFHELNPHVADELERMALDMKRAGVRRYSVKALFEVLRYRHVKTFGESFKLNNNYTSFYADLLVERRPELGDFFERRKRRSKRGQPQ